MYSILALPVTLTTTTALVTLLTYLKPVLSNELHHSESVHTDLPWNYLQSVNS